MLVNLGTYYAKVHKNTHHDIPKLGDRVSCSHKYVIAGSRDYVNLEHYNKT